jgi:hypothetical protein
MDAARVIVVTPAQAGVQGQLAGRCLWIPACAGMTILGCFAARAVRL